MRLRHTFLAGATSALLLVSGSLAAVGGSSLAGDPGNGVPGGAETETKNLNVRIEQWGEITELPMSIDVPAVLASDIGTAVAKVSDTAPMLVGANTPTYVTVPQDITLTRNAALATTLAASTILKWYNDPGFTMGGIENNANDVGPGVTWQAPVPSGLHEVKLDVSVSPATGNWSADEQAGHYTGMVPVTLSAQSPF